MNVVVLMLALAMMASGAAALVSGAQFGIIERGATMVIAGAVVASAGAILVGLVVVARRIKRLTVETVALRDTVAHSAETALLTRAGPAFMPPAPPDELVFEAPPLADAPPAFADVLLDESPDPLPPRPAAPLVEPVTRPVPEPVATFAPSPEPTRITLPMADPEPVRSPDPGSSWRSSLRPAEDPVPTPPPTAQNSEPEEPFRPEPVESPATPVSQPEAEPAEEALAVALPEPEPEPRPAEPAVVGRYASGDNTYVMYADGSVLATTPGGEFRFASLDELKGFIDRGARP